jgi:type III secretion system YscQ/HrcQ family protein
MSAMEQIAALADIPVDIEAELDRRILTLGQVLALQSGSVLPLRRSAGENIDLLAGGAVIGYGEIVMVDNALAVRITDFKNEG